MLYKFLKIKDKKYIFWKKRKGTSSIEEHKFE